MLAAFPGRCAASCNPPSASQDQQPALDQQLATVLPARVVRIAPNRAAAPRDSRFGQNELLGDSAIRRFGDS